MRLFENNKKEFTSKEWLKYFVNSEKEEYLEKANADKVSLVEYLVEKHEHFILETMIYHIFTLDVPLEYIKEFHYDTRLIFKKYLAKDLDDIDMIMETKTKNSLFGGTFQVTTPTSYDKLKYIGDQDNDNWKIGELYSIIEVSNWFHNKHLLGYYITTEDYDGDDIDYACFYPMGELSENFEIIKNE